MLASSTAKGRLSLLLAGFLLGCASALVYFTYSNAGDVASQRCIKSYPFTSHALDCEDFEDSRESLMALDAELEKATSQYVREGKAESISVWVRDLVSRQWAANNEFETFAPASLLKLPLAIAYYKFAQVEPSILQQELLYEPALAGGNDTQDYLSATLLQTGGSYSVERLIEEMLINSDNNAAGVLLLRIDPEFYTEVLKELGILVPQEDDEIDFVTTKTYANILRVLYNSSYLNREYSEKLLATMSRASFRGLADPLPENVQVAHKFGEREAHAADGSVSFRELHDCGIVYKEPHPYSICIMTKGKEFDDLLFVIKDLSKKVYGSM